MSLKKSNLVHPDSNAGTCNTKTGTGLIAGGSPGYHVVMKQPQPSAPLTYSDFDHVNNTIYEMSENNGGNNYHHQEVKKAPRIPIPSDCPKGLEPLVQLEHLFIKQSHLVTEFFMEAANKFEILDSNGDYVFLAAEKIKQLNRIFCFGGYPFELAVNSLPGASTYSWNAKGKEVMTLNGSCGSCGCGGEVTVTMGKQPLGSIEQEGDCTRPSYSVRNTEGKVLLLIQGPDKPHCFACGFGNTSLPLNHSGSSGQLDLIKFEILLPESRIQVGRIARQHVSIAQLSKGKNSSKDGNRSRQQQPQTRHQQLQQRRESVQIPRTRENELWGLKFPLDLDPSTKGLLLSAVYLLVRISVLQQVRLEIQAGQRAQTLPLSSNILTQSTLFASISNKLENIK